MGMYDTVTFLNNAPKCTNGHEVTTYQTKDMENSMTSFVISNGEIYEKVRTEEQARWLEKGDTFYKEIRIPYKKSDFSGGIEMYAECNECPYVHCLYGHGYSMSTKKYPWTTYKLIFIRGEIVETIPVELQTIEDVKNELVLAGGKIVE